MALPRPGGGGSSGTRHPRRAAPSRPTPPSPPSPDAHGEAKVSYPWLAPGDPAKWKEEHLVFVVLGERRRRGEGNETRARAPLDASRPLPLLPAPFSGGWALGIWTATKVFGGGKKDEAAAEAK